MPLNAKDISIIKQEIAKANGINTIRQEIAKATADMPQYLRVDGGKPTGLQAAFPIGSLFISAVVTNPKELLGYGVWERIGKGKTLVGLDETDTAFDKAEETGGAKTHTLTTPEMPAHNHYTVGAVDGASGAARATLGGTVDYNLTSTTGGGGAHNNLQPYFVVYFWKRVS